MTDAIVPAPHGRLELTWTNKDLRLLADEAGGYEWVRPADWRVAEVRLLHDVATVGDTAPEPERARDNLLIRGDALHLLTALNALPEFAAEYAGKVRLVYIDPPFNTGRAFTQYDDALEHSVWLTMLRDRLVQIKALLAPNGSVWVHCDDVEQHRLRVVMDEVFGSANFIATVVWQKIHARNNSAQHFSTDHDFIHIYAKDSDSWARNRVARTEQSDSDFWNPDNDPRGDWRRSDLTASKHYSDGKYEVVGPHGDTFAPRGGRYWGVSRATFAELESDERIWWGTTGGSFPFRKRFKSELGDLVPTTIWPHEEVGNNREAKGELTRLFGREVIFDTPKPERLMMRIIEIASDPGDIVLDCFVGSGTTAAVAQKVGRRWVACEWLAETIETFALPRLKRVVEGDDPGGVTETAGWTGGGGFRVLDVAPTMFELDEDRLVLAEYATNGFLGEATAAQLGFEVADEPPFCGRQGRQRLAVVDGLVNEGVVRTLVGMLPEDESLVICGTAIDPAAGELLRSLRRGSRLRKIPSSLLSEYRLKRPTRLPGVAEWAALGES